MAEDICKKLREAAEKLKLKVEEVDKLITEALEKGKKKASEIIAYIRAKMVDLSKVKCADILGESVSAISMIKLLKIHSANSVTCEN